MIKVIWRDWYRPEDVTVLTKMGTLPRNEAKVAAFMMDGEDAAREIAKQCNNCDGEQFREGGRIVIVEPEEMAGTYDISVDYEPSFFARKVDDE